MGGGKGKGKECGPRQRREGRGEGMGGGKGKGKECGPRQRREGCGEGMGGGKGKGKECGPRQRRGLAFWLRFGLLFVSVFFSFIFV